MDNKIKHLELIQGVITRMSNNSFLLKGWSVILVSALFALAAKESKAVFIYLAYFPVLAFWLLDAYFLRQEKLYRGLYEKVRKLSDSKIDFSMDTSQIANEVDSWGKVALSCSLVIFHGAIMVTIMFILIMLILIKLQYGGA